MRKNIIMAAALAVMTLAGASSCKSEKAGKADENTQVAEVPAPRESQFSNEDQEKAASYGPDFFNDKNRQSETPSDSTYVTTPSGLKYVVMKEGDGKSPTAADQVTVHYTGRLTDGTVFDSSVSRGEPAAFPLGAVIPGWTEGLQLMKEGGVTIFYIPSDLAYGERGAGGVIAPNSDLIFEVELIKVN
ncbi:MAG: FKBP-type peptidyl-prolyl cis-trans isomerase [Muribaculaceae bacterium]|nr:FKBP-type peptidyl-prolyl cis-trans isomerase [Muribaculaceae bacterium]